ncbi:Permease of the drug/metabolite transporter (DMT) superfamily [Pasteurella testudinis DSM 23072]|uniref:Permease of the drug/metabolite transporter (DMT) superfamily n=1 Tax=Pasteurella testudinis DSM 23072 TaxID=1122938 RepID=A0A1W1UW70_9PAST|nr:DMT family transporter [Pasteurella testudinis]SMB85333.1 Permease of the drug/metabolite transporter (DMT) superfamily [Pasteurella testudinis DSM 23072]SUB51298.1 RhaT protein [Pasteurella testudinis]
MLKQSAVALNNQELKGHLIVFLTILTWGTTYVATKVLLQDFRPLEILVIRFVIGFIALCLIYPRRLPFSGWKQEGYFTAAGLSGITLYFLLENIALLYTQAINVGIIIAVAPLLTALCNMLFLGGAKPNARFYLGFTLAMIGVILISLQNDQTLQLNPFGDLLAFLAALVWAVYSTLMKKISEFGHRTLQTTRRTFLYGLIFMLPLVGFTGFNLPLNKLLLPHNLLNILFLGLCASSICFVSWNYSVKILGTVKTSLYIYLVPVITVISAVWLLNEKLTALAAIGIVFTLLGLGISERKR